MRRSSTETSLPLNPGVAALHDDMVAWRHDIHRHPELAYAERRTAGVVAGLLRQFGVDEVVEGVGGTGVVGVLRNGVGPTIGLRADMDALPIEELADRPYRSIHPRIMHACGHDGHTAMLLGAARHLAQTRSFRGTVVLIFQPAEEGQAGARAMIEDGLFERFPVDAIYGLHNMPGRPTGSFAVSPGAVMAAADRFQVVLTGRGGHAAAPHLTRDPLVAAAAAVTALQTVVSRNVIPTGTLVVSVTEIHAGEAFNVIPDSARLGGTVRYFDPEVGAMARRRMQGILDGIAAAHEVSVEFTYMPGYPPTVNSAAEADLVREVAIDLVGEAAVGPQPASMFSEDFSFYLQLRPGAYAFIGNGEGEGDSRGCPGLHNPYYDFNDAILPTGAGFFCRLVERALPR
ncbi:MAG: M20 family metallopeptidase [Alphaproteobacteria bacterium]